MRLDAADWLILRELFRWDAGNFPRGPVKPPVQELAARTGLHRNSIRARLAALREGGVLLGSAFLPRSDFLGFGRMGYGFDGVSPATPEALEEALAPFPGVELAILAHGLVFMHVWHRGDADRLAQRIGRALDATRVWPSYVAPPPRHAPPLPPLDARILLALRRTPARAVSGIAKEARVSTRTLERRLQKLQAAGAGGMAPRVSLAAIEGAILVEYVVTQGDGRANAALERAFPDRVLGPFGPGVPPQVAVPVANLDQAERRRAAAEREPGIARVQAILMRELVHPRAFDAFLAQAVADAQRRVASD
ncbi:MAG: hypothetical protein QOE90_386 [Thermoplasmata archaeon]|nr:hypothetical protein [Thermoplasmata archaeon]